MWVHISTKAKTVVLQHKSQSGNTSQIISTQTSTIIVEKHQKFAILVILHNRNTK